MTAALIIPALDEEQAIAQTLAEIPAGLYGEIIVADNGSQDRTAEIARQCGATVIREPRRGYGAACQAGIAALGDQTDIVVFMDADGSDVPAEGELLLDPIRQDRADFVLGSRETGRAESGALSPHQRFGNALAVTLVRWLHGQRYTDLGPFRAIRRASLESLGMSDRDYGWTIEMQIKAAQRGLRIEEIPVESRVRRAGRSKVSGSILGSAAAGGKILWTVARLSVA
jgi:glycosyltransferase involved in cell wall biosynthesis